MSATSLPFAAYDPASPVPHDSTGSVTVNCSVLLVGLLASWTITLSPGASGTYFSRQLANGAARLNYNLYTTPARTTIWGNGAGGTGAVSDSKLLLVGSNVSTYTIYGRIAPLQDARAGSYADTIVVTINY